MTPQRPSLPAYRAPERAYRTATAGTWADVTGGVGAEVGLVGGEVGVAVNERAGVETLEMIMNGDGNR